LRSARDAVRDALVTQGAEALEAAATWLHAADTPPRIRRHLPRTISRFSCQRAADILIGLLDSEPEGAIRYKALRGLGRLARETPVELDARFLEQLLGDNLSESLRMRSAHFVIESGLAEERSAREPSAQLLLALLSDKADQAGERAFRILQLLHPGEDVRGIADAILTGDKASHARALEYLSTLALDLERKTRELLRLVVDNLDAAARVESARAELDSIPETVDAALDLLQHSGDDALASVAEYYARRRQVPVSPESPPVPLTTTPMAESKRNFAPISPARDHVERSG
jgi:hypothetical protein